MDIDIIFDDHNYAARRHGSMCMCTGNTSSESDDSDSDVEESTMLYKKSHRFGNSSQDKGLVNLAGKHQSLTCPGPLCACDGLASSSSSESSSEDETVIDSFSNDAGIAGIDSIGVSSTNQTLSTPQKTQKSEMKEVGMKSSIPQNMHREPKIFSNFESLKWPVSWYCYSCHCQTQTARVIPYCDPCFMKTEDNFRLGSSASDKD